MTDKNKNSHEPKLKPVEQGVRDEIFLAEDHRKKNIKPPYLLFALILFGLAGMFWKMAVRKTEPVGLNYEQRLKDAKSAQREALENFQKENRRR